MTAVIRSLDRIDDPGPLEEIVGEYLGFVTDGFARASGHAVPPATMAAQTFGQMDKYLPPEGRTWLAEDPDGRLVGVVFLKRIGPAKGEVKRLYVRPAARGRGLARRLMTDLIAEARAMGLARLVLDTGRFLTESQRLYESLGFRDIPPYAESENPDALRPFIRDMGLDLSRG